MALRLRLIIVHVAALVCIASALRMTQFPKKCTNGIMGICKKGSCPEGGHCIKIGAKGLCCRDVPIPPIGKCPPDSGLPGPCWIKPYNCFSDSACPKGQLCCSEGCGRVCKNALGFPSLD